MNILALTAGDYVVVTIALLILAGVIGGMVKFVRAIAILRRGRPEIDEELLKEHEDELKKQDDEQEDE